MLIVMAVVAGVFIVWAFARNALELCFKRTAWPATCAALLAAAQVASEPISDGKRWFRLAG